MNIAGKIICRTVGTAGMGLALYDAVNVAGQFSKNTSQRENSKYLEKAYFNSRTVDTVSYRDKAIQEKIFDMRSKNPLPSLWGKIKGGSHGFFYSLGNNLLLVSSSALALTTKGFPAKIGAIGAVITTGYNALKNSYGINKHTPMD